MGDPRYGHNENNKQVFIGRLDKRFSEEGLKNMLSKFGSIVNVMFKDTYAIVTFADSSSASNAVYEIRKNTGLKLKADFANEKRKINPDLTGGRAFEPFEIPVEPSSGSYMAHLPSLTANKELKIAGVRTYEQKYSNITPSTLSDNIFEARPCFSCKEGTLGQCKSCLTSFCGIDCMRSAAELHASFCQKFGYRDSSPVVPAITLGNKKQSFTSGGITHRETLSYSKLGVMENSRFMPISQNNNMLYPSRFPTNFSESKNKQKFYKSDADRNTYKNENRSKANYEPRSSGGFNSPALQRMEQRCEEELKIENRTNSEAVAEISSLEKLTLTSDAIDKTENIPSPDKSMKLPEQNQTTKDSIPREKTKQASCEVMQANKLSGNEQKSLSISGPTTVTFICEEMGGFWVLPADKKKDYESVANLLASSKMEDKPNLVPSLNALGAAKYDNIWYRVKVTAVNPVIKIHFIDYGNTETCKKNELKELPPELYDLAPLVFHVKFIGESPEDLLDKDAKVRFLGMQGISEIVKLDTPELASSASSKSSSRADNSGSGESDVKKSPKNEMANEQRFPLNCDVNISNISSSGELGIVRADQVDDYKELLDDLNIACQKAEPMKEIPKVNSLVAARFSEDGTFYRAKVVEFHNNKVTVFFTDYGNQEIVDLPDLRSLPLHLKEKPPGAITVTLSGFTASFIALDALKKVPYETKFQLVYNEKIANGVELLLSNGKSLNETLTPDKNYKDIAGDREELGVQSLLFLFIEAIDPNGIVFCANNTDTTLKIMSSIREMGEFCKTAEMIAYRPHQNEVVAAMYNTGEEEGWARAVAFEYVNTCRSRVLFIDYGNIAEVDNSQIRCIPPKWKELPALANQCIIKGYAEADECKRDRCKEELLKSVLFEAEVNKLPSDYELVIPIIQNILME